MQQRRYLRINQQLHLVLDQFYYQAAADTNSFIDHQLLASDTTIQKLLLPGMMISLQDGKWQVQPEPASYNADAITRLLDNWRNSQAYDVRIHKGELPKADIQILGNDEQAPINFSILSKPDYFVLLRHDNRVEYYLDKSRADELLKLSDRPNGNDTQ